jgi:hypothetical protein
MEAGARAGVAIRAEVRGAKADASGELFLRKILRLEMAGFQRGASQNYRYARWRGTNCCALRRPPFGFALGVGNGLDCSHIAVLAISAASVGRLQ